MVSYSLLKETARRKNFNFHKINAEIFQKVVDLRKLA